MNTSTKTRLITAALTLANLFGCASGGGNQETEEALVCLVTGPLCPFAVAERRGTGSTSVPAQPVVHAAFSSWTELGRDTLTAASGITSWAWYDRTAEGSVSEVQRPLHADSVATVQYDAAGNPVYFQAGSSGFGPLQKATGSNTGIDMYSSAGHGLLGNSSAGGALVANPYTLGWNYQSFGAWNETSPLGNGGLYASSFGSATPAHSIPTSGQASFAGKLGGYYISPSGQGSVAAADVAVNADFSKRSLTFASSGTLAGRDLKTPAAAPHLNLSGTLTYLAGSNSLNGTLTNAGGTMSGLTNGRFYGPAAQELGGVFTLRSATSVETFTGAYGAKR